MDNRWKVEQGNGDWCVTTEDIYEHSYHCSSKAKAVRLCASLNELDDLKAERREWRDVLADFEEWDNALSEVPKSRSSAPVFALKRLAAQCAKEREEG